MATTAEAVSRWEGIALFVRILSVFIVWSILLPGWHLCVQHGDPRPPSSVHLTLIILVASSSREVVHRHHEERNHHGCSLRLTGLGHITGVVAQKRDICCPQSASSPLSGTSVRRAGLNFRHAARGLSSRIAQPRPVSDGSDHNQSLLYWGALRSAVQSSDIGSRQKILQRIFCRRPKNRVQTRHNDPTMTPTASLDMQPTRPGQLGHRGGRHRP